MQKYVLSELDSGERVISERVPSVRSVAIGFWIGAGSRDERDDRAGVSHFIEHLLFKGSRSYDAQEIAETFDAMGAELNAATSREHTVVYSRVPDRHVDTAIEVMTDMVFAPSFSELDQEREVVLEEIAMYEDSPQELVHDLFSEAVFGPHALGRPVIGTADVISAVSRRAVAAYHRSMYTGGNIVVSAAGSITHEKLVALLQRAERRNDEAPGVGRASGGRSCARRRRDCASSARTRSSTTSASARPASRAPTAAGSRRRCSTPSSAAPRRRACSRRSARSGGWRTPSTASRRSTATRG